MMQAWKTLSRRTLLKVGKYLVVENHTVELPDGKVIEDWPWIITPDYVNIVALTPDGHILAFRQVKYAVDGDTLAAVGGYLDPGEQPLAGAQRELREETGYTADEWRSLGSYSVDSNRGCGTAYFFLARGAHQVAARDADDLEEQELLLLTRPEVATALTNAQFKCLPWATIMALALPLM
jgi:ADP-ribose pyrophosphatase